MPYAHKITQDSITAFWNHRFDIRSNSVHGPRPLRHLPKSSSIMKFANNLHLRSASNLAKGCSTRGW